MDGVIAFCLFGSTPMYTVGAIRNAELAPRIYPGWRVQFHCGDGVPNEVLDQLKKLNATLEMVKPGLNPMIARFMAASGAGTHFIIRDTDSRLCQRERLLVNEWLYSGEDFHLIRDHSGHGVAIPGGLWGGKCGILDMPELIRKWTGSKQSGKRDSIYGQDQNFLRDMVWPIIQNRCFQHDLCYGHIFRNVHPVPRSFDDIRFCGEVFDEHDNPEPYGWQRRLTHLSA